MASILALSAAPAIVRADALMRIVPRETLVLPHVTSMAEARGLARDILTITTNQHRLLPGDVVRISGLLGGVMDGEWRIIGTGTDITIRLPTSRLQ